MSSKLQIINNIFIHYHQVEVCQQDLISANKFIFLIMTNLQCQKLASICVFKFAEDFEYI